MRLVSSFGLIGTGAFAAGMFYSKYSFEPGFESWLLFAVSAATAAIGLVDLLIVASRNHRGQIWVRSSR